MGITHHARVCVRPCAGVWAVCGLDAGGRVKQHNETTELFSGIQKLLQVFVPALGKFPYIAGFHSAAFQQELYFCVPYGKVVCCMD